MIREVLVLLLTVLELIQLNNQFIKQQSGKQKEILEICNFIKLNTALDQQIILPIIKMNKIRLELCFPHLKKETIFRKPLDLQIIISHWFLLRQCSDCISKIKSSEIKYNLLKRERI